MQLIEHPIQIGSNTWTILYYIDYGTEEMVNGINLSAIRNESNGIRTTFYVVANDMKSKFSQYYVEVHQDIVNIATGTGSFGVALPRVNPKAQTIRDLYDGQRSNNARGEEQAKILSRITAEIVAKPLNVHHDVVSFDNNEDMTPIQPLIFTLTTTSDSATVNILNAVNSNNIQTSIDGGDNWSNDLVYNGLSSGNYTILVKERESIILDQEFIIE